MLYQDRAAGLQLLRRSLNLPDAEFRPGQWESIEALLRRQRVLVVQRTGWGKSMVYFLATRLLRDRNAGPTLLISPLLSLMRNQIQAAERIGVNAATINSTNKDDWSTIEARFADGEIDILLISPERLANDIFRQNVLQAHANDIGLFVVDEAHCISDWGHDFRPDYKRIVRVLRVLPENIPVLATTATANNRVVNDVAQQLGNLQVVRGPLIRDSLKLQTINLPSPAARMAWLADILPKIEGSGIIYTLTVRDAERVAEWLRLNEIDAIAYHARTQADRELLEDRLLNNEVKALVATVALGMGFDKPDLAFVIHFQRPGSVVHYYQQVGRAGRAVDNAYGILLSGEEDQEITDYFINSAFPPQVHITDVLDALQRAADGLSVPMLQQQVNLTKGQIDKVLILLSVEKVSPVTKQGSLWYRTPTHYQMNFDQIEALTQLRRIEQAQMQEYMEIPTCLMRFLAEALDDPHAEDCGKCASCAEQQLLPEEPDQVLTNRAAIYLRRSHHVIKTRKQWMHKFQHHPWSGNIPLHLRAEEGMALALWGDAGWGLMVRQGKYHDLRFHNDLIEGCVEMIQSWEPDPFPEWLTCVPSLKHPELIPDFANRLAQRLGIPYIPCVCKVRDNAPQKQMQNSYQQAQNLDGAFAVEGDVPTGSVFLLDDMVDSRWTITVITALLREQGSGSVFPLALALNSLS